MRGQRVREPESLEESPGDEDVILLGNVDQVTAIHGENRVDGCDGQRQKRYDAEEPGGIVT